MFNFKEIIKNELARIIDNLNRLIGILLIIFFILSIFISNFVIDLIPLILLILFLFRLLSKNKYQRNKENNTYLKIKKILTKPFNLMIKNLRSEQNIYRRCHKCKTILKLPLPDKRGIQHAICPKCGKRVTFFTFRKVKIELIKKKRA